MANDPNYRDSAAQTEWAGLMQISVRPETLFSAPYDTTTPPAEMADMVTEKPQFAIVPDIKYDHPEGNNPDLTRQTLIERRANRPGLVARISLPETELNDEVPLSPPPTHALLSPLPEANTRHAGHTPLLDRARSPEDETKAFLGSQPKASSSLQPNDLIQSFADDEALTGSLILPTDPSAANNDSKFITLDALDHELGRIARQQRHLRGDFSDDEDEPEQKRTGSGSSAAAVQSENQAPRTASVSSPMREQPGSLDPNSGPLLSTLTASPPLAPSSAPVQSLTPQTKRTSIPVDGQEEDLPLSRKESADSRRSIATEEVDGVILKTPPSNFGAPIGQL